MTQHLFLKATALLTLFALSGCGGSTQNAFSHQFADNRADHFATILARMPAARAHSQPHNALGEPLVVVATHGEASERGLAAFSVANGEERWRFAFDAQTRPEILGDVVLTSDRQHLVALDLRTGRERWRRPLADLAYVGATRDGDTIFYSSTVGALGGARRVGHVVAVDASNGSELWRYEVHGVFGQPAATGGMVMIPWERQNLAILDATTGVELARLRSTDDVIAWAFDDPSGIYYGYRNIYRMNSSSVSGVRSESTHLTLPLPTLPVLREGETAREVEVFDDGFLPKPGTRSARGRIRLYFAPDGTVDSHEIKILGNHVYFVYFRYVFGYDLDGTLRFARILEEDVIGAEPTAEGLFVVGEQGQMHLLDKESGLDRWSGSLHQPLASVALDIGGSLSGQSAPTGSNDLRASLSAIAVDPDNRLVPARAYAIQTLAALEESEITRDLLDLYAQQSMPSALRQVIASALRTRRTGSEYLIAALRQRFDFIEQTQVPPLEVIVPSLLEMQARDAVPGLMQQLQDHETPATILPMLIHAIVELGDASIVPALQRFLVLYRADSAFQQYPEALAEAATGIFRHGGPEGRTMLTALVEESRTNVPLREAITGLYEAERLEQESIARREAEAAQEALAQAAQQAEAALPGRLTPREIDQAFAEHVDALRECAALEVARTPTLGQVRLVFILTHDGHAEEIGVAPNSAELTQCMREHVTAIQFPRFRQRRMRGSYVLSLRAVEERPQTTELALSADAPWWAWSEQRAETHPRVNESERAWWERRPAPVQTVNTTTPQAPAHAGSSAGTQSPTQPREATPWWTDAGAESDADSGAGTEGTVDEPATPEPAPPPAEPRGRRSRRGRAEEPVRSEPVEAPVAPSAPAAPPAAPPAPTPPAAPQEPEPPAWWAPAEGG